MKAMIAMMRMIPGLIRKKITAPMISKEFKNLIHENSFESTKFEGKIKKEKRGFTLWSLVLLLASSFSFAGDFSYMVEFFSEISNGRSRLYCPRK